MIEDLEEVLACLRLARGQVKRLAGKSAFYAADAEFGPEIRWLLGRLQRAIDFLTEPTEE
jgi:hypothetical protein